MKLFTLFALMLTFVVGCGSAEEKKKEEQVDAQEQYQRDMQKAEEKYETTKKKEAHKAIDEGADVKKVIEVEE